MQQTAVKPPAAAARVPLAMVSLYSKPGSRRCVWMSMNPGHTTLPVASTVSAPAGAVSARPTLAIRPSATSTSTTASTLEAGSSRRPFLMRRLALMRDSPSEGPCSCGAASGEQIEHGHPDRHAVGHLVEDHRIAPIGDLRRELDAAIDGAGMHDEHVGPAVLEAGEGEPPDSGVLADGGDEAAAHPLVLQPQHHDHVGVRDGLFEPMADLDAQFLARGRDQRGWTGHRDGHAHLLHAVDVRACHATVRHV